MLPKDSKHLARRQDIRWPPLFAYRFRPQNQNNFFPSSDRKLRGFSPEHGERPITIDIVLPFDLTDEQRISRVAFSHDVNLVRLAVEPSAPPPSGGTPLDASINPKPARSLWRALPRFPLRDAKSCSRRRAARSRLSGLRVAISSARRSGTSSGEKDPRFGRDCASSSVSVSRKESLASRDRAPPISAVDATKTSLVFRDVLRSQKRDGSRARSS